MDVEDGSRVHRMLVLEKGGPRLAWVGGATEIEGPRAATGLLHCAHDMEEDPKEKTGQR